MSSSPYTLRIQGEEELARLDAQTVDLVLCPFAQYSSILATLFRDGVYQQVMFLFIQLFNQDVGMSCVFRSIRLYFPEIGWKEASGTWGTFGLSSLSSSAYQRRHWNLNLSVVEQLIRALKAFHGL